MRLLLFFAIFPGFVFAQNLTLDWEKTFPNTGNKAIRNYMEATNGYLVSVGETSTKTQGGSDGLLFFTDYSTGQVIAEKRFGGGKDDALYAAAQTFDGNFLLAGTTASIGLGGPDAWLLLVNERGEKIWETSFGTPGRDECRGLLSLSDGTVLMAGTSNNQKNGDIWLAKVEERRILWEKNVGSGEFETLGGIVAADDGGFVFCGNTGKKAENGAGNVYLAKVDANGVLIWKKFFGEKDWEEALGLIATNDGGFAISGLTKSKGAGDLDCWLIKTSRDGFRQWDKTYGGKDADVANAVIQTVDNGFLLAGSTKSHRSGARFSEGFLIQTSPGGDLQWEKTAGTDKDDVFTTAQLLHNGSFVVAGTTNGDMPWMLHYTDPYLTKNSLAGIREVLTLKVSNASVSSADGTLTPGANTSLAFKIFNTTDLDLPDLNVSVNNRSGGNELTSWATTYYGTLKKGDSAEVHIPLRTASALDPGEKQLALTISSGTKSLKSFEKTVTLRNPQAANLLIAGHQFNASGRSDEVTLNVQIENSGDFVSQAAEVVFECPAGISVQGSAVATMGVISAHSTRDARLSFVKTAQFSAGVARIVCVVKEAGREKARKTLEWQANSGKTSMLAGGPIMIWSDPAPHETGSNKVRKTDDHIEVKMTVVSPKPLNTKDIKIKVNGVEMDGSKFNEEDLSPPRKEETKYIYTYKNKIPLQQGNNHIEVVADDQVSDALDVEFAPQRANLFVLAIGPQHEDLQYTAKDAGDFAKAFQNQGGEGKLFNEVFVTSLTTSEKTGLDGIRQAMYDLEYQWQDKQITQSDVLLVFISSHGKIVENRFKILQSGYNPKYEQIAVDFKTDILEVLNNINCKKLVFIDACHSGGAKEGFGGLNKAIVDLSKTLPGVSTLTSCGSTEKSYEDKAWENGAFTEALLSAFSNEDCKDTDGEFKADADGNKILSLGELYDFLRRRVPNLVQNGVPNAPTSQTPFMPEAQLDKTLPLYFLGNQ